MTTQTPARPVARHGPIPFPSRQCTVSVVPRLLFFLVAAFMILVPVMGPVILDPSGASDHLELVALVVTAPLFAASAVILGSSASPGRAVSRRLETWINIAVGTLLAGVLGTALALLLASSSRSVSELGAIAVTVAYLGLAGHLIAGVRTLILDRRAHDRTG